MPAFLRLLSSSSATVREQAVWAIGNIMGDCAELRDRVVEEGAIPRLYDLIPGDSKVNTKANPNCGNRVNLLTVIYEIPSKGCELRSGGV